MFFIVLLSLFMLILVAFVAPLILINALLPIYMGVPLSLLWFTCAVIWFLNSSEWILQAYHSEKLSFGKRVDSYIGLENFFDAKSRFSLPRLYVQKFSSANPFIILTRGGKFTFILSHQFYGLLNDDHFSNLLGTSLKKSMLIPFWLGGKMLSLKLLYLQFFSSFYYQSSKLKGRFLKTIALNVALLICYITMPLFMLCGWLYSQVWLHFIHQAIKKDDLSPEVWEKLEFILKDDNQMSLLGYLLGTGHGEVRAHPLVSI